MSEPDPAAGESEREGPRPDSTGPEHKEPASKSTTGTGAPRQTGGQDGPGSGKSDGIVGQVVGTTSFFAALLFYMGWNYLNSQLSPFLIPTPQSIGLGTTDFAASGIYQLFASNAVFFAAVLVAVILVAAWTAGAPVEKERGKLTAAAKALGKLAAVAKAPGKLFLAGLLLTVIMLTLIWPQASSGSFPGWLGSNVYGVYLALALLAGGQLLMTWPTRRDGAGRVAYSLALVVVAVLALWAGGVYASTLGAEAAQSIEDDVQGQPAVAVYSAQPLDLSGPGVMCARVQPGPGYSYECAGLRLLYLQAGTYYLLPEGWAYNEGDSTYILDDNDQIRIELYCPVKNPVPLC